MSSTVSANNSVMSYLTQLFAGSASTSSRTSSAQAQSTSQALSAGDVVKLSAQALQMQNSGAFFASLDTAESLGLYSASSPPSSSALLDNILATLPTTSASQPASNTGTSSLASQMANYQSQLQLERVQGLFGTGSTGGMSGSTLSMYA